MQTKLFYENNGHNYDSLTAELPPVAIEFYLQYGYQQSCGDGRAQVVTDVMVDLMEKAKAAGQSFPKPKTKEWKELANSEAVQDIAKPLIHAAILKRIERVNSGTVSARESDPFAARCKKVALAILAVKAKKVTLPDRKSDKWKELVEETANTKETKAEAKRQLDNEAKMAAA